MARTPDFADQAAQSTYIEQRIARHEAQPAYAALQNGDHLPRELWSDYERWGEDMSAETAEEVTAKERLLGRFALFEPAIDRLLATIQRGGDAATLGTGGKSFVYRLEHDGQEYAVRLVSPPAGFEVPASQVNRYAANMYKAIGRTGIEQLQTISFTKPVTVSNIEAGKPSNKALTGEALHSVSPQTLGIHLRRLRWLFLNRMATDNNPENTLFDKEEGFNCIDLGTPKLRALDKSIGYSLAFLLGQTDPNVPAEDYELRAKIIAQTRAMLGEYFTAAEAVGIDEILAMSQRSLLDTARQAARNPSVETDVHFYAVQRKQNLGPLQSRRLSPQEWVRRHAPEVAARLPRGTTSGNTPQHYTVQLEGYIEKPGP